MEKYDLHDVMQKRMTDAENRVVSLEAQKGQIEQQIEYWRMQADAARTVSIRLHMEVEEEKNK